MQRRAPLTEDQEQRLTALISEMEIPQIHTVYDILNAHLNDIYKEEERKLMRSFNIGEEVRFKDKKGIYLKGIIKTLNKRTVTLEKIENVTWRVPYQLLFKTTK
jgi:hypothetical protein